MIRAIWFPDYERFKRFKTPGSFYITAPDDEDQTQYFWYYCPCGCGHLGSLLVGNDFKPSNGPSWLWNGSEPEPTLHPSVHHVGHWHGWLKNGYWKLA